MTISTFPIKMLIMFTRLLTIQNHSVFLFGPRGTGKSTWIQQHFPDAPNYNLLKTSEVLRLSRSPSLLYEELQILPADSWVVIDEVQKVPKLLNEVHRLMEEKKLRFILCGSSARKLKKESDNLLAGRARQVYLFPLVSAEVNYQIHLDSVLQFGMLPMSFTTDDKQVYLQSYVETYLKEEIQTEALTRNIGNFSRFLEIAARQNGQVTNTNSISRDAEVARQTVQGYFEILKDTLIGDWLFPWKLKRSTKQVAHPKFYLFDPGVVRALSGRLPYPPTQEELGFLLETFLLNELKAFLNYNKLYYPVYFWSRHRGLEVDFFLETKEGYLALECKASPRWQKKYQKGLARLQEEIKPKSLQCIGLYLGEREALFDNIRILPVMNFLKELWSGKIIH